MVGFTVAFFAIFKEDEDDFGQIWLGVFKAMLGEVGIFDEFSDGSEYGNVATLLLVVYLVIMAVMLLNLLIAVLSTEHARADKNAEIEFRESKVRLMKHYRRVVAFNLLPAPFNLLQLAMVLPFAFLDKILKLHMHDDVELAVGRAVFWLMTGPPTIVLGWLLWVVSTPKAITVAWSGTNYSGRSLVFRVLCCSAVAPFHILGAPFFFSVFWIQSGVAGALSGTVGCVSFAKAICLSMLECRRRGVEDPGSAGDDRKRGTDQAVSVVEMLGKAPEGLSVREIWEYLEDPTTPTSPAMRREEQNLPSTVSHIRLLRNQLEDSSRDGTAELRARVDMINDAMETRVGNLEGRIDDHFRKLEQSMDARIARLEEVVADTVGAKMTKLEEELTTIASILQPPSI